MRFAVKTGHHVHAECWSFCLPRHVPFSVRYVHRHIRSEPISFGQPVSAVRLSALPGYEPNALRSSAFFGDLDEPDMSMAMAVYRTRRWVASKSMESQRIRALSTRWPLTVCSVHHCLRRTDGTASREVDKRHCIIHKNTAESRVEFGGVFVLEDPSSMLACTVEATKEIKIMAG